MSILPQCKLQLTHHAYKRYVERISPINRTDLLRWCRDTFSKGFWYQRKTGLIEFGDTWWGCEVSPKKRMIFLTTCYGRGRDVDFASAVAWERKNNDIVRLNQSPYGRDNK